MTNAFVTAALNVKSQKSMHSLRYNDGIIVIMTLSLILN